MLNVLVMIALFGAATGETEGEMQEFVVDKFIPIDFTKSALEVKTNYATQYSEEVGFWFNDGTNNLLGWRINIEEAPNNPQWNIMECNFLAAEITPPSKVLGPRTWIFSLKDGRISVLLDGEALITGVKPGEDGPGKCNFYYWDEKAATPVKGIKFSNFGGNKVEGYRVIPIEDTDSADQDAGNKETEDTDRTEMSGASQLGSGIVLVTALLAFLGF